VKESLFAHWNLFLAARRASPISTLVQLFASATLRRKHFAQIGKILAIVPNGPRIMADSLSTARLLRVLRRQIGNIPANL
jgi:hypothetical protein